MKRPQHGALNSPQCAKSNKISSKNSKNVEVKSFDRLFLLLATLLKLTAPPLHHSTTIPHTHMYKHAHVHAHARPETILRTLSGWLALPGNVFHYSSVKFKPCSHPADKLRPNDLPHLGRTSHSILRQWRCSLRQQNSTSSLGSFCFIPFLLSGWRAGGSKVSHA